MPRVWHAAAGVLVLATCLGVPAAGTEAKFWGLWNSKPQKDSQEAPGLRSAGRIGDHNDMRLAGLVASVDGEDTPVELLARRLGEFADNDDYLGDAVDISDGKGHQQTPTRTSTDSLR
eukprot:CAMPEP_0172719022 /NCGR_PEP_ID=MMETSP1074-20121228/75262_1 /TAXON_ID=2916 /ORGANISM="Ceratium fusus, Strain PA161109" /LENGTH=117 /DNA_ID=CAMNT_0013544323 /DNA_START=61 /DNA_END=410 /DNA_ORIENTATION=+